MFLPPKVIHPEGEAKLPIKSAIATSIEVETFDGKIHIEWDPDAKVTPLGQLPFFIEFLKVGGRLKPWIDSCPLEYESNNAPKIANLLGTLLLSILSGHTRYSHITTLFTDKVNPPLLGMTKLISDDSVRRALKKMPEEEGVKWLQTHLGQSYEPLLTTPWILDTDVTVKPLYGKQEGAKKGYNPHKPGRPSHTYHTYMIANLRLVLDVELQAGDQSHSSHSLPGLIALLDNLPVNSRPQFIRGDCDWGNEKVMAELEEKGYDYLFKVKKTSKVKALISKYHGSGNWTFFKTGWEAKEAELKLQGWSKKRRVVIVRRQVASKGMLALEYQQNQQMELAFVDGPEDMRAYEYSVLITSLESEVVSIVQHYRDRADCENNFDEIKNQWGWGGFTTKDIKSCRLIARMIALIYNWWTLFVRLAHPENHLEAITSRPLLLSSVGRLTESGRQKKMVLTSTHGRTTKVQQAFSRLRNFFSELKLIAPQLPIAECWRKILEKAMEKFRQTTRVDTEKILPAPA